MLEAFRAHNDTFGPGVSNVVSVEDDPIGVDISSYVKDENFAAFESTPMVAYRSFEIKDGVAGADIIYRCKSCGKKTKTVKKIRERGDDVYIDYCLECSEDLARNRAVLEDFKNLIREA